VPHRQSRIDRRGAARDGYVANNPDGIPVEVFDGFRAALIANRSQFFLDVPSGPFFGFNREGARSAKARSRTGGGRA
jgi:hypothetical protein